jgi:ABC-type glutathione transport system ATPase component
MVLVEQVVNELQAFVVRDGINGAGLASGVIVGGQRLLSGGEQQMVVLAQALVSQPKYILIDELSLGLAPVIVNQLIPVIRALVESGIGVLLIEQFAAVALSLATSAHVMEGGVLRYSGTAAELKARPDLLHSAYLLRVAAGAGGAAVTPAEGDIA